MIKAKTIGLVLSLGLLLMGACGSDDDDDDDDDDNETRIKGMEQVISAQGGLKLKVIHYKVVADSGV